jgi:hypothetical protein
LGLGLVGAIQSDGRGGIPVAEEVGIEVREERDIDENKDVEVGMLLLSPAEELPAVVDTSLGVEKMDGSPVTSPIFVGKTVVYSVTTTRPEGKNDLTMFVALSRNFNVSTFFGELYLLLSSLSPLLVLTMSRGYGPICVKYEREKL